jgi:hypothetical protein
MTLGGLTALASVKISEVLLNAIGPTGIPGLIALPALRPIVEKLVSGILGVGVAAVARFGTGGSVSQPTLAIIGDHPTIPGAGAREWIFTDQQLRDVVHMATVQQVNAIANSIGSVVSAIQEMPKDFRASGKDLRLVQNREEQAYRRRVIIGRTAKFAVK